VYDLVLNFNSRPWLYTGRACSGINEWQGVVQRQC